MERRNTIAEHFQRELDRPLVPRLLDQIFEVGGRPQYTYIHPRDLYLFTTATTNYTEYEWWKPLNMHPKSRTHGRKV